jgi:hypothetical protein
VIVTVIAMRMMQPAIHKIIDMVAMRDRFVSTVWAVFVWAPVLRRALRGICGVDRDDMFVDVILVHMVEMAIVKIVHMAFMENRDVAAVRTMLMGVVRMVFLGAGGHDFHSLFAISSEGGLFGARRFLWNPGSAGGSQVVRQTLRLRLHGWGDLCHPDGDTLWLDCCNWCALAVIRRAILTCPYRKPKPSGWHREWWIVPSMSDLSGWR